MPTTRAQRMRNAFMNAIKTTAIGKSNGALSEDRLDRPAESGENLPHFFRGGAEGWHDDDDIADGPREHPLERHFFAHATPRTDGERISFTGAPILNELDACD